MKGDRQNEIITKVASSIKLQLKNVMSSIKEVKEEFSSHHGSGKDEIDDEILT